MFGQDFHGEQAAVKAMSGEIDLCHTANTDATENLVFASPKSRLAVPVDLRVPQYLPDAKHSGSLRDYSVVC